MAKCLVKFEDSDDGKVAVVIEFDPLLEPQNKATSPAQLAGMQFVQALAGEAEEQTENEEEDE